MAYLKGIPLYECRVCRARASVELFNHRNASNGYYCARHGKQALAQMEARERLPEGVTR